MSMFAISLMWVSLACLCAALALSVWRAFTGPTFADRAVSLDLTSLCALGFVAHYAVDADLSVILDATAVLAVLAFLSSVAFAYLIERRGLNK